MSEVILRRYAVLKMIGISNSQMHILINRGEFPKPIPLGGRIVGWLQSEIDAWIEARIRASRGNMPEQAA